MMNQCHDHIGFRRDGSRSKGCGMRPRMLMAVLIMALGILGYIAYTHATADTRPRPANYRAAVMRVLDDQRVDYRAVEVVDGCAELPKLPNLCRIGTGAGDDDAAWPDRLP